MDNYLHNELCYNCNDTDIDFDTMIIEKNLIVNCCYFCNIVLNFNNYHMGKAIICKTNLLQNDIILKTQQFIKQFKRFPLINEIDNKCYFVKLSCLKFSEIIKTNKLKNFCFFFLPKNYTKYNEIFNMPHYNLTNEEQQIYNNYIFNKRKEISEIIKFL